MNTDAVRARNARKRAKLKAHKRGQAMLQNATPEPVYVYEFAVKGNKNPFPFGSDDAGFEDPVLPDWAWGDDFLEVEAEGPESWYYELSSIKTDIRQYVEDVYGFNRYDLDVLLMNVYRKDLEN